MSTMTVADAKNHFSDVLRRAEYGGERVIVERHGKPVAAIVSTEDLRLLEAAENAADVRDARAALEKAGRQGTIPLEAVLRKHGLDRLLPESTAGKTRVAGRRAPAARRARAPRAARRKR